MGLVEEAVGSRTRDLLDAKSVVLVGATERRDNIAGSRPIAIASQFGSTVPLYLVNPRFADDPDPRRSATLADLPEVPDLGVLAVPADAVVPAIVEASDLGTRRFVVFGAGFAEGTPAEHGRLGALADVVAERDLTVLGPASLGFASLRRGLFATFSGAFGLDLRPGRVGLVSQSGALVTTIIGYLHRAGIGIDTAVATGAQLQVTVEDALAALVSEPDSELKVAICFLEEVRDATALLTTIRVAAARGRTVVFMSGGATAAGASAARSHTGAQVGSYAMLRDLVVEAGACWVSSLPELVETVRLAERIADPAHIARVGVLTNSGGAGVLAADALVEAGFALPSLDPETVAALSATLPSYVTTGMPFDVGDRLIREPNRLPEWVRLLGQDPDVDAAILVMTSIFNDEELLARKAEEAVAAASVPVLPVFLPPLPGRGDFAASTEDAVAGLAALVRPAASSAPSKPLPTDRRLVAVDEVASKELLRRAGGFDLARSVVLDPAAQPDLGELEQPFVVKLSAPGVGQRLSRGLVVRHVRADDVQAVAAAIDARRQAHEPPGRILVEEEVPEGLDLVLAAHRDDRFGPVVVVGLGGSLAGVFGGDLWARGDLTPDELLARLDRRGWWITATARTGIDEAGRRACAEAACALAGLLHADSSFNEIEINPARVRDGRVWCLDARATRSRDDATDSDATATPSEEDQ